MLLIIFGTITYQKSFIVVKKIVRRVLRSLIQLSIDKSEYDQITGFYIYHIAAIRNSIFYCNQLSAGKNIAFII